MAIVVLRHCFHLDRRAAALLPPWERELLIEGGKRLLGIGQKPEPDGVPEAGLTPTDVHILTTPGVG